MPRAGAVREDEGMTRYLVVPQWQGSPSSRAMQLIDGAHAIAGDLPRSSTTVLDVPMEAGEALGTGIHRLSALQRVRGLVADALEAGSSTVMGVDQATWFVASVRGSSTLAATLGNDLSVELPDPIEVSQFCLGGLGLARPREWHEQVDTRLALTGDDGRSILRRLIKESAAAEG